MSSCTLSAVDQSPNHLACGVCAIGARRGSTCAALADHMSGSGVQRGPDRNATREYCGMESTLPGSRSEWTTATATASTATVTIPAAATIKRFLWRQGRRRCAESSICDAPPTAHRLHARCRCAVQRTVPQVGNIETVHTKELSMNPYVVSKEATHGDRRDQHGSGHEVATLGCGDGIRLHEERPEQRRMRARHHPWREIARTDCALRMLRGSAWTCRSPLLVGTSHVRGRTEIRDDHCASEPDQISPRALNASASHPINGNTHITVIAIPATVRATIDAARRHPNSVSAQTATPVSNEHAIASIAPRPDDQMVANAMITSPGNLNDALGSAATAAAPLAR